MRGSVPILIPSRNQVYSKASFSQWGDGLWLGQRHRCCSEPLKPCQAMRSLLHSPHHSVVRSYWSQVQERWGASSCFSQLNSSILHQLKATGWHIWACTMLQPQCLSDTFQQNNCLVVPFFNFTKSNIIFCIFPLLNYIVFSSRNFFWNRVSQTFFLHRGSTQYIQVSPAWHSSSDRLYLSPQHMYHAKP